MAPISDGVIELQVRNRIRHLEAVHRDLLRDPHGSIRLVMDTSTGWPVTADAMLDGVHGMWIPTARANSIDEALDEIDAILTAHRGRHPSMADLAATLGIEVQP